MPRQNIADLRLPPRGYRIDRARNVDGLPVKFETLPTCEREDRYRSVALASVEFGNKRLQARAGHLAERLMPDETGRVPRSLASKTYMRRRRLRIAGAVWQLAIEAGLDDIGLPTLVPAGWKVPEAELDNFDPRRALHAVRSDLNRAGAAKAEGWFFGFIDSEFDPVIRCYQFHLHLIASGGMIRVINKLRKRPKYRRRLGGKEPCLRPVLVRRKLGNLATRITYIIKSMWWSRRSRLDGVKRDDHRQRLPEPFHSQSLLWLDRWTLKDLTLLVHLRVVDGKLEHTPRKAVYTNVFWNPRGSSRG